MPAQRNEGQMKIYVRNNDVDKALRILKKKLHNEGVMKEVRDRRHFTPPGEEKRLAKKAGRKRWLKKRQQLEQQFVREERNQLRKNRKNKNVQRHNKGSTQHRNRTRSSSS
jgi:small subunit ribosomal protein S21